MLTAPRTYYVRSDGNDNNEGLADQSGEAFRTWQGAIDAAKVLDFGSHAVTIRHGVESEPKTFMENISIPPLTGGGLLYLIGSSTPGGTRIDGGETQAIALDGTGPTGVILQHLTVRGGGQGIVQVNYSSRVAISDGMVFADNPTFSGAHICVHDRQGLVTILGTSYTITGDAAYHIFVSGGFAYVEYSTVKFVGARQFDGGVFSAVTGGGMQIIGNTWDYSEGYATGHSINCNTNGVVNTYSGGSMTVPGNAGCYFQTGGQFS
jgi:hypothetical protein